MTLKFYTSVNRVKTKCQKVFGAYSTVCRSYKGKTGMEGLFASPHPILNRVKSKFKWASNKYNVIWDESTIKIVSKAM